MNTRSVFTTAPGPVAHHVEFNNDRSYFSVAHDEGFNIYVSESCELFLQQDTSKSIGAASMLGATQIIALLGGGDSPAYAPNKVALYDTVKGEEVAAISTSKPILRTCISDRFIAVVCDTNTNLYKHGEKIEKLASYQTASNSLGLCCLGQNMLVLPGRSPGQLQLIDLKTLRIDILPSHTSPLRAICLSLDGSLVASASQTGTLIRLHSTASNARLAEYRRGISPATIYSLDISPSNHHLAVTSDTSTLHIFALPFASNEPHTSKTAPLSPSVASASRYSTSPTERTPSPAAASSHDANPAQKWGSLAKLPFAPRVFSDVYSLASATFDPGKDDEVGESANAIQDSASSADRMGTRRAPKGVVGWVDDEVVVVVSAGKNARYERFALTRDEAGRTGCVRIGWSRYMQPN